MANHLEPGYHLIDQLVNSLRRVADLLAADRREELGPRDHSPAAERGPAVWAPRSAAQ